MATGPASSPTISPPHRGPTSPSAPAPCPNGAIDPPLDNLVFQLNHTTGGNLTGAVFVDDWRLTFPSAGQVVVEDYERLVPQELVWIGGKADTTFVVGEGIGPDLSEPCPT